MSGTLAADSQRAIAFGREMLRLTATMGERGAVPARCDAVLDAMRTLIPYDWARIHLILGPGPHGEIVRERGLSLRDVRQSLDGATETALHTLDSASTEPLARLMRAHALQHLASLPILVDNVPRGTLTVASCARDGLAPADLPYLEGFAGLLGMVAAPALARSVDSLDLLSRITEGMSQAAASGEVLDATAEIVARELDVSCALYTLADAALDLRAVRAPEGHSLEHAEYKANYLLRQAQGAIIEPMGLIGGAHGPSVLRIDPAREERHAALQDLECREIVIAPLVVADEAIGAVAAFRARVPEPSPEPDLPHLLPRIARSVAPWVQNALLREEIRALAREAEAVRRINQVAWESGSIEESVNVVARTVSLLFDADLVLLAEIQGRYATWYQTFGSVAPEERSGQLEITNSWVMEKIRATEPFFVREMGPESAADYPLLHHELLKSFLAVPFQIHHGTRGIVLIGFRSPRSITSVDIRFAKSLTHGVAATLMLRRLDSGCNDCRTD